jgi:hypothetical protein
VNATAIAVAVFCLLLLACGVFVTRMLWDDISAQLDADPEWSGWGEGLWSHLPRALPVGINGFALCGLALTPVIAQGDCTGTCEYEGATAVFGMVGLGLAVATLGLSLSTLLVGRPRILVPPPLRPGRRPRQTASGDSNVA